MAASRDMDPYLAVSQSANMSPGEVHYAHQGSVPIIRIIVQLQDSLLGGNHAPLAPCTPTMRIFSCIVH